MTAAPHASATPLDVAAIRRQFPILGREVYGKPLVYLDNAATTHKPRAVLDAVTHFYETSNANIHRGVHRLSQEATDAFEAAREQMRAFLGAARHEEIVFTRGTTESLNLVAATWARAHLQPGDEVLLSQMEHHSNIVPWQLVCRERGARIVVAPITDAGEIDLDAFAARLSTRTRIVSVGHVSNALGTVNPVALLGRMAHEAGALFVVDGAQGAPHGRVDVQALGADFYAASGHKMYGPTGIGVLYGRHDLLEELPPYQGGGEMILEVRFEGSTWAPVPHKFEAGTPDISGAVGLAAAAAWFERTGHEAVERHEADLLAYATSRLEALEGLRIVGTARHKSAVISFVMDCAHPHDVGTILDREGVAVRTGHHCAQPVMERFGVPATTRASFAVYNTREEVDALVCALELVQEVFAR